MNDKTKTEVRFADIADLANAKNGSWYFIAGAGGDLQEWIDGYHKLLDEADIGRPTQWWTTNGGTINAFAAQHKHSKIHPDDQFPGDLMCLLFPLDEMHIGKLAMFKLQLEDRWFDDVIQNMRRL